MIAGQLATMVSRSGTVWEYWFGVKDGKRIYLCAPVGSLNTWQFTCVKQVRIFISVQ